MLVWEIVAALFGVAYVILAAKQNILCWPVGMINVTITFFIVWQQHLYGYAIIQIVYFVMTINAWYIWAKKTEEGNYPVSTIAINKYLFIIPLMLLFSAGFWYVFSHTNKFFEGAEPSPYPILEAIATSVFIAGMRMQALKKLENWIMWIIGDIVYVFVFFVLKSYPLGILSLIYILVAVIGWHEWKKSQRKTHTL